MEGDRTSNVRLADWNISIHSLRMEGDAFFNSFNAPSDGLFQSTPSAWRETLTVAIIAVFFDISIHSLRMEGDRVSWVFFCGRADFNPLPPHGGRRFLIRYICSCNFISIHSLRMEGDQKKRLLLTASKAFQSTPSAWRETVSNRNIQCSNTISIHSLRMEGDRGISSYDTFLRYFNPLPPHGGRHHRN